MRKISRMQLIYKIEFNTTNLYFKYIIETLINEAQINASCKQYKDLRFGQCVFNITQDLCGCIVDNFRGLDEDCFYNDEKVDLFLQSIFNKVISKDDCTIN